MLEPTLQQGPSKSDAVRSLQGFSPFEDQTRPFISEEPGKFMDPSTAQHQEMREHIPFTPSTEHGSFQDDNGAGFSSAKGSRFAKFFDGKGKDGTIPVPKTQGPVAFASSPAPGPGQRQEHFNGVGGGIADHRAMDDIYAMLNSSSQVSTSPAYFSFLIQRCYRTKEEALGIFRVPLHLPTYHSVNRHSIILIFSNSSNFIIIINSKYTLIDLNLCMRAAWTIEISCQMEWSLAFVQHLLLELEKMADILKYWTIHYFSITTTNVFLLNIALLIKCILVRTPNKLAVTMASHYTHHTIVEEHLPFPTSHPPCRPHSNDFHRVWQISEGGRRLSLLNI